MIPLDLREYVSNTAFIQSKGRIKFSFQESRERNCGQHVLSMVTGLPVSTVQLNEYVGHYKGTYKSEICKSLYLLGYDASLEFQECSHTSFFLRNLPKFAILSVRCGNQRHWCLLYDGCIYDSCIGVFACDELELKKILYRVNGYIEIFSE